MTEGYTYRKPPYVDFQSQILDDNIHNTDVKINPDFYIHNCILKAQESLNKENVKGGFLQYVMMIYQLETLCRSANIMPDKYAENVEAFKITAEYTTQKDEIIRELKLANHKQQLLLTEVFARKINTNPIKV